MTELDPVLARLREIEDRLATLPQDAYEERAQLQARQRSLQAEAAKAREEMAENQGRDPDEGEVEEVIQALPDRTIPIVIGVAVAILLVLVVFWLTAVGSA